MIFSGSLIYVQLRGDNLQISYAKLTYQIRQGHTHLGTSTCGKEHD